MSKTKLIFHSNAPWTPTGYGQQTGLFAPLFAEQYDLTLSAFYGLEGAPLTWEGIPVLPGLGGEFGSNSLVKHAGRRFGGDPKGGICIMLADVWPFNPEDGRQVNLACWCPIDHDPAPGKVTEYLIRSEAIPIAMSRFGESRLAVLDPCYVPHAVDTEVYRPLDTPTPREQSFPEDAFVVGMVAANKGRPSRKAFSQALMAFRKFLVKHENSFLYLHTVLDPQIGNGENIIELAHALDIPDERIRTADQYSLLFAPYQPEQMATIYNSLDVLLNPSFGEGFGIPIIEAQACGIPAIATDWTAMPEVCGAGWHVKHQPYWTGLGSLQALPDIDDIVSALEECYELSPQARAKLSSAARQHALRYDVRRVWKQHWLPTMRTIEQRFTSRRPITVPSRFEEVAA